MTITTGIAKQADKLSWRQIYGAASLAGPGFIMTLLIGAHAFDGPAEQYAVRPGVLSGSGASVVIGYLVLGIAGG